MLSMRMLSILSITTMQETRMSIIDDTISLAGIRLREALTIVSIMKATTLSSIPIPSTITQMTMHIRDVSSDSIHREWLLRSAAPTIGISFMDMESMTTSTMHIMILSSIHGDGVTDGLGDLGAAGMADSGDGITLITGVTGDGDQDGDIPIGVVITGGTMDVTLIEEVGVDSAIASTEDSLSEPTIWRMEVMPVCQEVLSADVLMASHQELQAYAR